MKANPECLILEDDPKRLESLKITALYHGLHPLGAESAAHALRILENCQETTRPILAIVDRNMRYAEDQSRDSLDVLRVLASDFRECLVVVYSGNLNEPKVRHEVNQAHPTAILHDKEGDDEGLFSRLRKILTKTVGDLVLDGGAVRHVPSGEEHHHRLAIAFLMAYPNPLQLHGESAAKAKSRFSEWLIKNHSNVHILTRGKKRYILEVQE